MLRRVIIVCLAVSAVPSYCQAAPGSAAAMRQKALGLEQQGSIAEAEQAWRAYSQSNPANPEPYAHLGLLEAREGRLADAIGSYRKALAINANVPSLRLNLALAYFKSGQFQEAIDQFTALRKLIPADSPELERADILTGMSYYGMAKYGQAVPFLQAAANREKDNPELLLALAHSCLWSKRYPCVMDTYRQILTLNAESAEADMLAGEALDEMKDNAGATGMFRAAIKADPKALNVHFGLGYLLWTQKQYDEAAREFRSELENDPNHAQATLYLGDACLQMNRSADAKPLLQRAVQLQGNMWLAHLDLGIIDFDAGNYDAALVELQAAEKLNPDDVNVHWRLGRLLRAMGRKDEANRELEKARGLNKAADEDLFRKMQNGAPTKPDAVPK
jgi:tetratricopeptide (TPR) repeat protein